MMKVSSGIAPVGLPRPNLSGLEYKGGRLIQFPLLYLVDCLKNGKMYLDATTRHLNEYREGGLRTCPAYRKLNGQGYSD
ncbi:hypothetical protein Fmac_032444 [Flemingia macrophylla]|uniref:Uncharacterized protein n=1 Tax=Flemingia macrophylla TaxID=520843 RepID=A0ABD1L4W9_9FABA